jgi:hypothetical protein
VFDVLEPLGVMTTGGRSSTVGVGGLTLGGGISGKKLLVQTKCGLLKYASKM